MRSVSVVKIPKNGKNVARRMDIPNTRVYIQSNDKKWVRCVVFLICLTGFLYQTTTFLKIYLDYPTVVDVDVMHREEMTIPSITVCNKNRFRRSEFCNTYPEKCTRFQSELKYCSEFPFMCHNKSNAIYVPRSNLAEEHTLCNHSELMELGHKAHPLIQQITIILTDKKRVHSDGGNISYIALSEGITCPRNCYVLNSAVGKLEFQLINVSLHTEERKIMKLFLDLQPEEYFDLTQTPEALFAVHSPYEIFNPYIRGFTVEAGRIYYVDLTEEGKILLEKPYQTDCIDYLQEWRKADYPGPYTWEMCVHYCKMNRSIVHCNCVSKRLLYPSDSAYCTKEDEPCQEKLHLEQCYKTCKPECYSQSYKVKMSYKTIPNDLLRNYEDIYPKNKRTSLRKRIVILIFSIENPAYVLHRYIPKYQAIEAFSFIGGYIGIWLGMSLFALFDYVNPAFKWMQLTARRIFSRRIKRKVWIQSQINREYTKRSCKLMIVEPMHANKIHSIRL